MIFHRLITNLTSINILTYLSIISRLILTLISFYFLIIFSIFFKFKKVTNNKFPSLKLIGS